MPAGATHLGHRPGKLRERRHRRIRRRSPNGLSVPRLFAEAVPFKSFPHSIAPKKRRSPNS